MQTERPTDRPGARTNERTNEHVRLVWACVLDREHGERRKRGQIANSLRFSFFFLLSPRSILLLFSVLCSLTRTYAPCLYVDRQQKKLLMINNDLKIYSCT